MNTLSLLFKPWLGLGTALFLALGNPGAARAIENHTGAWGLISRIGSQNPLFDAVWLVTGDPADPFVHDNLLYVDMNMQYNYPSYGMWESATWRPANSYPTQRFTASLLGTDEWTQPIGSRYIQLRNLTLERTDLDTRNVQFRFSPFSNPAGDTSLTLNNSSLTGEAPGYNANAHFTLTALGDSRIAGWGNSQVFSQATLNVKPGSVLNLFRVAFTNSPLITNSWYFNHSGDVATIDGGTLRLDQSFVTFGRTVLFPGETYGQMTFQNNALLDIIGEGGRLVSGDVFFRNSRLNLGSGNHFKAVSGVTLDGATLTTDENSELFAETLDVYGNNRITLGKETRTGHYIVTAGAAIVRPDALLTLKSLDRGRGSLAVTFQLRYEPLGAGQQQGRIVIDDNATLVSAGALFDIAANAPITINRTSDAVFGALAVENGGDIYLRASAINPGQVTNHGQIGVGKDSALIALGPNVIQGGSKGLVNIASEGTLMIGNPGDPIAATQSLTTSNTVYLDNFSALKLTLDPTARKSGQLRAGSQLTIERLADLHLDLVNDTVLPDGTKFTLINYGAFTDSQHFFNGYPNGSTFVLGLNHYRINYADTPDPGYNGAITLTVVAPLPPVSLSPALQTVTGTVGAPLTQTAAMIPSGFGGTVTYTISPGLPNGLTFNNATGAIFGTPTAALTTTAFTIRAAGSVSGTATATVNLSIGVASQTISFGAAPTPTFASGGGFQVFASASSGLPVTYSSQTPAICEAHGSTIMMLGAGVCTIAADQPGNANYTAAPQATQSITIAPARPQPLTLSASSASITVGGTSTLNAAGGIPGGSVTYSVTGACSAVGSLVTGGPGTGTCTATATQAADANYLAVTSNPVAISVGVAPQAALSLTASPTTITVNGVSTLTANGGTGSGSVTYTLNSGPCTLAGNVLTGTGVGQCQVTATKAESTGYSAATSNPVIVNINRLAPPALVLTASPVSVGFGGSSTLSTTGGIPGAPVSYSVSGPCSVDGNTLLGIRAGLCIVTASQAETAAYSAATSSPVTITVKERTTTFSYPQATAKIGQPFSLAPVTSGFTKPTFALLYGNLPAGLTLDPATGVISGTPTGPIGTIDGVVSVYENNAYDAALAVITIANPAPPPNPIPTLGEWGAIIMTLMLILVGGSRLFGR
jgi:hypothetical protein